MNNNVEMELKKIKKQSRLRSKYFDLIEKELEKNDVSALINNKKIKKMELALRETKKD